MKYETGGKDNKWDIPDTTVHVQRVQCAAGGEG